MESAERVVGAGLVGVLGLGEGDASQRAVVGGGAGHGRGGQEGPGQSALHGRDCGRATGGLGSGALFAVVGGGRGPVGR